MSSLSTPTRCLLLILSCIIWMLVSAGAFHSLSPCHSSYLTLPCHLLLCLLAPTLSLSVFSAAVFACLAPRPWVCESQGDGEQFYWGRTVVFCKCKQLILSRPAGCSAQLSVNRHKIMFIRARNQRIPLMDSTPPATSSFSSTSLVLALFLSSAKSLFALSPETGCSL